MSEQPPPNREDDCKSPEPLHGKLQRQHSAWAGEGGVTTEQLKDAFRKMDPSERGRVSAQEIQVYLKEHGREVQLSDVEEAIRFAGAEDRMLSVNQFVAQLMNLRQTSAAVSSSTSEDDSKEPMQQEE